MLGSYLIFAREGIEGTLICAILLTFLAASGRRDLFRWVLGGAAVAVLTYMTFWMRRHARTLSSEIRGRAAAAVAGGSAIALAAVAFATVGREAVETVLFLVAIAYQSSPLQLGVGAALGLGTALAVGFAMYRVGVRVNLGRFFSVLGSLLLVVAAGLLANAVHNLQALGALPGASFTLWNASGVMPDDRGIGDVLHGLVGYSEAPTLLQAVVWAVFLGGGLWLFLRPTPPRRSVPAPSVS